MEVLLKEYESCQKTVDRLESIIWKTSGFTALGSAGAFIGILSVSANHSIGVLPKAISAIFIVVLLFIWRSMSRRWHNIQILTFYRMKHIEEELGMFQVRYVFHKDVYAQKNPLLKLRHTINTEEGTDLNKYIKEIDSWKTDFHEYDVMKFMDWLPWIVLVFFVVVIIAPYMSELARCLCVLNNL